MRTGNSKRSRIVSQCSFEIVLPPKREAAHKLAIEERRNLDGTLKNLDVLVVGVQIINGTAQEERSNVAHGKASLPHHVQHLRQLVAVQIADILVPHAMQLNGGTPNSSITSSACAKSCETSSVITPSENIHTPPCQI